MHTPSFLTSFNAFWRLLWQLGCRDVQSRYKGSVLGILWSLITPILTVGLYTFLFSVVFHAQWGEDFRTTELNASSSSKSSHAHYALILFTGLMLHTFLADIMQRSTGVIVSQANLVKKVVFPACLASRGGVFKCVPNFGE